MYIHTYTCICVCIASNKIASVWVCPKMAKHALYKASIVAFENLVNISPANLCIVYSWLDLIFLKHQPNHHVVNLPRNGMGFTTI